MTPSRRRDERNSIGASPLRSASSAVLGVAGWMWIAHERAQRTGSIDKSAMTSAKTLLEDVLKAYNDTEP